MGRCLWRPPTCRGLDRRPRHGCYWSAVSGAGCGRLGRPKSTCDPGALTASLYPARAQTRMNQVSVPILILQFSCPPLLNLLIGWFLFKKKTKEERRGVVDASSCLYKLTLLTNSTNRVERTNLQLRKISFIQAILRWQTRVSKAP